MKRWSRAIVVPPESEGNDDDDIDDVVFVSEKQADGDAVDRPARRGRSRADRRRRPEAFVVEPGVEVDPFIKYYALGLPLIMVQLCALVRPTIEVPV